MEIRPILETDYDRVIPVVNDWWGGRQMTHLLPKLFFEHFQNTSFVMEEKESGKLVAFLIGFQSQTHQNEAYIHFVGVHPDYRKQGTARTLYELFFEKALQLGCDTVRCITSAVNETSMKFHTRMGFKLTMAKDYAGPGQDYILFEKKLNMDSEK
ncbi:GNAT family N-acetyltransferase [Paenibacillus cellulositrophicus]|uniref:GNAT family N-acetyltransferase n=1 Tax=Paenibacillus cellulositrophicus TaxID=562959 RepID=UPI0012670A48|nr:GNAT family N-acetyltransferase [Paenibacillus cellulositrophicus]